MSQSAESRVYDSAVAASSSKPLVLKGGKNFTDLFNQTVKRTKKKKKKSKKKQKKNKASDPEKTNKKRKIADVSETDTVVTVDKDEEKEEVHSSSMPSTKIIKLKTDYELALERLTPSELSFLERQKRIQDTKLDQMSQLNHRQRIDRFNQRLASESEHYDIPRVGPG